MAKKYSDKELLNIAKKYSGFFTTTRSWELFAKENHLPRSNLYKKRFGSWNQAKDLCGIKIYDNEEKLALQKELLLSQFSPYKNIINTAKDWDQVAKGLNLPLSHTIIHYFGKWDYFKKELNIYIDKDKAKLEKQVSYLEVAKRHIHEFSKSAEKWKEYAKINGLPSTNTYITNFGSWTNAQLLVGVDQKKVKSYVNRYDKEFLIKVAKENISYFINTSEWDRFATTNNLPNQYVFIRVFGSMAEAKKAIGIIEFPTRKSYTKEELIQIALEHISYFTTQTAWDNFARENNLPRYRSFANAFGSWKECKNFIHNLHNNKTENG